MTIQLVRGIVSRENSLCLRDFILIQFFIKNDWIGIVTNVTIQFVRGFVSRENSLC